MTNGIGAHRHGRSRDSQPKTALVVSADPRVRSDWARYFASLGMPTLSCAGPQPRCERPGTLCPLHAAADLAVYERATITPELMVRLIRAGRSLVIALAVDHLDPAGRHAPRIRAVAPQSRDACVGLAAEKLGR